MKKETPVKKESFNIELLSEQATLADIYDKIQEIIKYLKEQSK